MKTNNNKQVEAKKSVKERRRVRMGFTRLSSAVCMPNADSYAFIQAVIGDHADLVERHGLSVMFFKKELVMQLLIDAVCKDKTLFYPGFAPYSYRDLIADCFRNEIAIDWLSKKVFEGIIEEESARFIKSFPEKEQEIRDAAAKALKATDSDSRALNVYNFMYYKQKDGSVVRVKPSSLAFLCTLDS
jgi:hypothetical protein